MKKKNTPSFTSELVMPRYFMLVAIFACIALAILIKASYLMFFQHDYWMEVSEQFKRNNVTIPAVRGNIYSADGEVLATSLPEYRMYMDFMSAEKDSALHIKDQLRRDRLLYLKMDSICMEMHKIFPDINPTEFKKLLLAGRAKKSHHWELYKPLISYIQYRKVKELPLFRLSENRGGFHVETFRKRKKPYGNLARATIGTFDPERDNFKSGLEKAFDKELSGKPGLAHRQKVMNRYLSFVDSAATDGYDVYTTLDVRMQDLVEKTLGDQLKHLGADLGMCILMDVPTGDVKAMSSLTARGSEYIELDNRALYSLREPGSVFKPVSFMAAFEDGVIDMHSGWNVGCGVREMYHRPMRDSNWGKGGYGCWLSVVDIIKYSSNVGVSSLIDQAYHNDPGRFVKNVYKTGIHEDLGIPLSDYHRPNIRMPQVDKYGHWLNWSATALPWMSIGYETQIPPIQTLSFYNGIANGGKMVKPRFVTAIKRGDEVVKEFPTEYIQGEGNKLPDHMMCSPATLKKVKTCLEAVVGRGKCTGKDVYTPKFNIAGKTGTAQILGKGGKTGKYIISFVGYFPAEKPKYSMIVCIEKSFPAYGGAMCGPVFKKIAETIWAKNIFADLSTAKDSTAHFTDVPEMRSGNLRALSEVLGDLNVKYNKEFNSDEDLVWGRNASGNPSSALLCAENKSNGKTPVMPNVIGYGLRDAIFRLERMGLVVKTSGTGRVVRQSIPAGQALKPKEQVEIFLSNDEKYKESEPVPAPEPADSLPVKKDTLAPTTPTKKEA